MYAPGPETGNEGHTMLLKSLIDFFRDGGLMLAGSLSYFSMMAIIPFCLFLVTIFGYFLGEEKEFYLFLSARLTSYFPDVTHEITEELKRIITYRGLGKFSLALYGFLSYQVFSSLETTTNAIFKVKGRRSFVVSVILSLCIITALMAFILISFSATSIISILEPLQELFPDLKLGGLAVFFIRFVIPFVIMFVTVAMLYILLPQKRVSFRHAVSGALFTAVFLETAKHLFTLYVVNVFRLGTIYGPLSAFVIFLLWVFYSACIFLIGAEVVHNLEVSKGR
jgi:membrane protein